MGNKQAILIICIIIAAFLVGCKAKTIEKTGEAVSVQNIPKQDAEQDFPKLPEIDISGDAKKEAIFESVKQFLLNIEFPDVDGLPSKIDSTSFVLVGFLIYEQEYVVVTQFRLNTIKGQLKKQYTIRIKESLDGKFFPSYVREDK